MQCCCDASTLIKYRSPAVILLNALVLLFFIAFVKVWNWISSWTCGSLSEMLSAVGGHICNHMFNFFFVSKCIYILFVKKIQNVRIISEDTIIPCETQGLNIFILWLFPARFHSFMFLIILGNAAESCCGGGRSWIEPEESLVGLNTYIMFEQNHPFELPLYSITNNFMIWIRFAIFLPPFQVCRSHYLLCRIFSPNGASCSDSFVALRLLGCRVNSDTFSSHNLTWKMCYCSIGSCTSQSNHQQ